MKPGLTNQLNRNIILIALLIAIAGRLAYSYQLNENLLGGSDFTGHITLVDYIAKYLDAGWFEFWHGGYPLIKYVSPDAYLMASFLALFAGDVIAYKMIIDFFFLLAPVAFLLLIKDFRLSDWQKAAAVLFFSFFPAGAHYFFENSFTTTVNIVFALLFWKSVINYSEKKTRKNLLFSGLFFSFMILVHQLTAVFAGAVVFVWAAAKYRRIVWKPFLIGALISAFWLFPFLLEYRGDSLMESSFSLGVVGSIINDIGAPQLAGFAFFFAALLLFSLKFRKDRDFLSFAAAIVLVLLIVAFSSYLRAVAFVSIPAAFLFARVFPERKWTFVIVIAALAMLAFSFYSLRGGVNTAGYESWEVPVAPDRMIFYPNGYDYCEQAGCPKSTYSSYLAPKYGREIIDGMRFQYLMVGGMREKRFAFFQKITSPLNSAPAELSDIFRAGFVNSIVVNKNFPEFVKYFSDTEYFIKTNETEHFLVFGPAQKSTFIELDSKPVESSVERGRNALNAGFDCSPGMLLVKESYDNYWTASISGEQLKIEPDRYGFMEMKINKTGACVLEMRYNPIGGYGIFYIISFVSLLAFAALAAWKK
ncbi:MAG: 6-pyruvoyl-tetrahydropterin synthase-related protein [Candidatus Aenigmatarchaeota archaeon]